jgi:hypothetical protein
MTPDEGWQDLRRRLPDMNRRYVRQRALRWVIRGALVGGAGIGGAIIGRWMTRQAAPPAPSNSPLVHSETGVAPVRPSARTGLSTDPPARVEGGG